MIQSHARHCLAACGAAAILLATPGESQALFHLFGKGCGLFGHRRAEVAYSPVCNPCATQVVNYVPQTCFRPQCVTVPVTTYRPFTTCDPCTGCPVTAMRPVVTYARQTRMVAYTTYRPVYSTVPASPVSYTAPACNGCASAAPAYPAGQPYYPGQPQYAQPPYAGQPSSYNGPAGTGVPSLPADESPGTSTFENDDGNSNGSSGGSESRLRPIPDPEMNKGTPSEPTSAPRLIDPDSRTAIRPSRRAWGFTPVSWPPRSAGAGQADLVRTAAHQAEAGQAAAADAGPPSVKAPRIDDTGWRPSSR